MKHTYHKCCPNIYYSPDIIAVLFRETILLRNKIMKHLTKISRNHPKPAQITFAAVLTALSQIMQVVGTALIEKETLNPDPYDY